MNQVRVRMYRPGGIGDCFLLSFPKSGGMAHMLIDCGILKGTGEGKARMQAVVANVVETTSIAEATRGYLDVLVVTHEHWDHVSGFLQAKDQFDRLSIGEVWLAWTERPDDALAKELREHKKKASRAVDAAVQKLKLSAAPTAHAAAKAMSSLRQFSGDFGAAGANSTAAAMTWVREGSGAQKVCWLEPAREPLSIAGVEGVRVFVLGPPRNSELIKRSDPSKRTPEVYRLAAGMDLGFAAALVGAGDVDSGRPFDPSFETPVAKARGDAEFSDFYNRFYYAADDWRQIELDWLYTAERLALQLDSDTNNTSLALAIELIDSGRVLLFPGDAQVGNWLSWESCSWTVPDRTGRLVEMKAERLLEKTVLYKVGHHGSHNATLKEKGLELMKSDELVAMIPVYEKQALDQGEDGWKMPFEPLLTRLKEKASGRVIRADDGIPDTWSDAMVSRCIEREAYIDYLIDL